MLYQIKIQGKPYLEKIKKENNFYIRRGIMAKTIEEVLEEIEKIFPSFRHLETYEDYDVLKGMVRSLWLTGAISFRCYAAIDQLMIAYQYAKKGSKRFSAYDLTSRLEEFWRACTETVKI
ncbi:MAG: hypothetical protein DRN91_06535 [Candidatus Alkanophagales archaeon]|nr:MAG: hypothetical protein DRN91_06535 [Candidatus Alkanophagales archaeon]